MSGRLHSKQQPRQKPEGTDDSYRDLLEESKKPRLVPTPESDTNTGSQVATDSAGFTGVGEGMCYEVVLRKAVLKKIEALAIEIPEAARDEFIQNATLLVMRAINKQLTPQPDQETAQVAGTALDKVKGDATLLRQWLKYQQLVTSVVLPKDGRFKTLEEARNASNLAVTYSSARARQKKVGVELVPENDKYIKQVASAATTYYQKAKQKSVTLVA